MPAAAALESFGSTLAAIGGPAHRRHPHLDRRTRGHLCAGRAELRHLDRRRGGDPQRRAPAGRGATEPAAHRRRVPLRDGTEGPAWDLPDRHERHVLRHALRALPGHRGAARWRPCARACSMPRPRSGRSSPAPPVAGPAACTGTGAPSRSPRRSGVSPSSLRLHDHALAGTSRVSPLAGAADMVSAVFRLTIWNQTIPDGLRGRFAGIEQISYMSGPLLGNVEAGLVASFAGIRGSVVSGGVLCVAGTAALSLAAAGIRQVRRRGRQCTGRLKQAEPGDGRR